MPVGGLLVRLWRACAFLSARPLNASTALRQSKRTPSPAVGALTCPCRVFAVRTLIVVVSTGLDVAVPAFTFTPRSGTVGSNGSDLLIISRSSSAGAGGGVPPRFKTRIPQMERAQRPRTATQGETNTTKTGGGRCSRASARKSNLLRTPSDNDQHIRTSRSLRR
jgi:hypothetical protein